MLVFEGGYRLVQSGQLLHAWRLYQTKTITLKGLRTYLAAFEVAGRWFRPAELSKLVGGKAPLKPLLDAGLLNLKDGKLHAPRVGGRPIPFPRRLLRALAAKAGAALLATTFGHLIRCLFLKGGQCLGRGRCKASWIAETFGANLRRVKAARALLVALGWLDKEDAHQWEWDRWGATLTWRNPTPPTTSPRHPPDSNKDPLRERKKPVPGISHVRIEDLKDPGRALELHAQASRLGLVNDSEADRLKVLAAASHALALGNQNPPGLFATILRKGLWNVLTQADEDAARRRLREHLFPPSQKNRPDFLTAPAPTPQTPEASDARAAKEVIAAARESGFRGDPFLVARRMGWDRPRWEAAINPPRTSPPPRTGGEAAP